jgi:hypothetical protein
VQSWDEAFACLMHVGPTHRCGSLATLGSTKWSSAIGELDCALLRLQSRSIRSALCSISSTTLAIPATTPLSLWPRIRLQHGGWCRGTKRATVQTRIGRHEGLMPVRSPAMMKPPQPDRLTEATSLQYGLRNMDRRAPPAEIQPLPTSSLKRRRRSSTASRVSHPAPATSEEWKKGCRATSVRHGGLRPAKSDRTKSRGRSGSSMRQLSG